MPDCPIGFVHKQKTATTQTGARWLDHLECEQAVAIAASTAFAALCEGFRRWPEMPARDRLPPRRYLR